MLRESVESNGNGSHSPLRTGGEESQGEAAEQLPAEGSLKRRVLDTARSFTGKFDTRAIVEQMTKDGFTFGRDPMLSVNQAVRHLARKKLLRLVRAGAGRQPNIFEARKTEGTKN